MMLHNLTWSVVANTYRAVLQAVLSLALAYFLTPYDFGLVALVLPATLFVLLIGDLGLSAAIVRSANISSGELNAAASFCCAIGALLVIGYAGLLLSGVMSALPIPLGKLGLGFTAVVLLAMSAIIPRARLERQLNYGKLALIETAAVTLGAAAALLGALNGLGVWSFLIYHLSSQFCRTAGFWWSANNAIHLTTQWHGLAKLLSFGGWIISFNIVNYLARNLDNYIVGGVLGAAALGIYALAYQVMLIPLMAVTWPVSGVLIAALSRYRADRGKIRETFLSIVTLVSVVTVPAMGFVAVSGPLAIRLYLPQHWAGVAGPASHLAIAGALQSVTSLVGSLFIVDGLIRQQFFLGLAMTTTTLGGVALAALLGGRVDDIVNVYVSLTILYSVIYATVAVRILQADLSTLLAAVWPAFFAAAAGLAMMELMLWSFPYVVGSPLEFWLSGIGFIGGLVIAIGICWRSLIGIFNLLRSSTLEIARN